MKFDYPYEIKFAEGVLHEGEVSITFDVRGNDAYTLPPVSGTFEDGWTIDAEIHENWYEWINDFSATNKNGGWVKGNFEHEVIASSVRDLEDFLKNHKPQAWDYWDI